MVGELRMEDKEYWELSEEKRAEQDIIDAKETEAKERYYKNMFSKSLIGCSATFNHETGKSMGCLARELCDNCLSPPDHLVRKAQSEFHKTITGRTVFHKSNMEEIPKKNRLKKIRNEIRKNRAKIRRMRFTAIWRGDNM
ncbi:hypothetical protein LCGC14_3048050, partial [marine sediment metagenome]